MLLNQDMTPETRAQYEKFRRETVARLVDMKWPQKEAEECVDLALHAVDESSKTVARICQVATHNVVELQALALATQILAMRYKRLSQETETVLQLIVAVGGAEGLAEV